MSSEEQTALVRIPLRRRQVIKKTRIAAQCPRLDVLGNPHHIGAWERIHIYSNSIDSNTLADRVLTWPERLRHRRAHHHRPWGAARVLHTDPPSAQDVSADGCEIVGSHGVEIEVTRHRVHTVHLQVHVPRTPKR